MPNNIKSLVFFSFRVYQNRQLKMSRAVRRPTFRANLNAEVSKDEYNRLNNIILIYIDIYL